MKQPAATRRRPGAHWTMAAAALLLCSASAACAQMDGSPAQVAGASADGAGPLAGLPAATSRPLAGSVETRQFGAAGLVKAFDLAAQLAGAVCAVLPADRKTAVFDAHSAAGMAAARIVSDGIERMTADLAKQNKSLQLYIETRVPPGSGAATLPVVVLAAVPAVVKAVADATSVFKSNVLAAGTGFGDGARDLFATGLGRSCPGKIAGLGSGYLGELDPAEHDRLLARVRALAAQRNDYANRIAVVRKLAAVARPDDKKEMTAVAKAAEAALKTVDDFVDSLKAGEATDRSPLFNAARYLGYANRTAGALVLDFDLRLEGLSIVKDNLFTGQHLRLSGVAFLWYRLHEPDGTLRAADALRRITAPVDVDLRGEDAGAQFWNGQ